MIVLSRRVALMLGVAVLLPLLLTACGKTVGDTIDDATITTRVKTALLNDPDVGALRIDVNTAAGVVTLSGAVKSTVEAERAVQLARTVQGVKDVKSTLQVQTPTPILRPESGPSAPRAPAATSSHLR